MRALLFVALLAGPASATELYVVAAGNNVGTAGDLPLRYAEADAVSFGAVMQRLAGARGQDTAVVSGEPAAGLRRAIVTTNARIRAAERDKPGSSVLVVYYSGHADATGLHLAGTELPYGELKDLVRGSPATVRLLIIDGCRSGTLTRVKGLRKPGKVFDINVENRLAVEGVAIITSSTAGEDSHESDRLRGSYFTHHLINALKGAADRNGDRTITLDEAYGYAYTQTLRSSSRARKLQHPTYDYDIKGRGSLVLTRLTRAKGQTARLGIREPGLYVIFDQRQRDRVVAEVVVGKDGGELVLRPGDYRVQLRKPRTYRQTDVSLAAGGRADLDAAPHETLAYARLLRKGGGEPRAVHGLQLLAAARGEILAGAGITGHALLGYSVDFEWLTMSLRGRYARGSSISEAGEVTTIHEEIGVGLVLERVLDLSWLSFSVGLGVEGLAHMQTFQTDGEAPDRTAWGVGLSLLAAAEAELGGGLSLRIEGGPRTDLFDAVTTTGGAPTGRELASPLSWWVAAGLTWRL